MDKPAKEDVDSVVDEWITNMLSATPATLKAQRTAVNEDYEKLLSHMDLSRPEGCVNTSSVFSSPSLGLGAELTHGRLVASMAPADKILHRSLKQGAQKERREELNVLENARARKQKEEDVKEPTKGSGKGKKTKVQQKLQLEVKVS